MPRWNQSLQRHPRLRPEGVVADFVWKGRVYPSYRESVARASSFQLHPGSRRDPSGPVMGRVDEPREALGTRALF
jgi:hypothetical protein